MGKQMGKQFERKIDYDQLQKLLDESPRIKKAEIARRFGVGRAAITKAVHKLENHVHKITALEKAPKYATYQFTFIEQQNKDINVLNDLLDRVIRYINGDRDAFKPMQRKVESKSVEGGKKQDGAEGEGDQGRKSKVEQKIETFDFTVDPRLLAVTIIREVREHLKLQLDAFNVVANANNVLAFQRHVLDIIGEIAPDARAKIIDRLRSEHAIRAALILD
jgi:hypothetical protein